MRTPGRPLLQLLLALATACAAARPVPASTPADEAAALFGEGRFAAAAGLFAAAIEQSGPDGGRLHFDLGVCLLQLGRLADAEYHMRRAVILLDEAAGPGSAAASAAREGLATVLIAQGNMLEAEEVLDAALAARTALFGDGHPQVLRTLDLMASVHWLDGQPQQALDLYLRVMAGLRAIHGNVHPLTATTAQNIGAVQLEIRSDWTAEIMFRQAVCIVGALRGAGHPDLAAPLCGLGDIFTRAGMPEQAVGYYERALAATADGGATFSAGSERVRALEGLGRLRIAAGDPAGALGVLTEAVTRHDRLRARAGGDMEAATMGGSPRPLLAHALLLLGRGDEAWRVLEGGRGRLGAAWRSDRGDSLRFRLLRLEAAAAGAADPTARLRLQQQWNDCDAALTAAQAAAGPRSEPDPAVVQTGLAPGDVLLGWLDAAVAEGQRAAWVYVLTKGDGPRWFRLADTPWRRTPRLLQDYRDALIGSSAWDERWSALADTVWNERLAPASAAVAGAKRLLVVTAAPLGGVPLAPLGPRGGPMLLDRCDLVAAPSAWDFTQPAASAERLRERPALVVADPPYGGKTLVVVARGDAAAGSAAPGSQVVLRSALGRNREALASLPPLSASRDEAAAVRAAFPRGPSLLGPRASEADLDRMGRDGELGRLGIIHLATHALVDCRAPDRSALILAEGGSAPSATADGLLTAREVRLGWDLDADLVTLSACETGLGRQTFDDGMLSMADAFLAAGSRNVVSSLWKVEDQAAARLMAYFYAELAEGSADGRPVPVPSALGAAQRRLRDFTTPGGTRPWRDPWAWSAFVTYGGAAER